MNTKTIKKGLLLLAVLAMVALGTTACGAPATQSATVAPTPGPTIDPTPTPAATVTPAPPATAIPEKPGAIVMPVGATADAPSERLAQMSDIWLAGAEAAIQVESGVTATMSVDMSDPQGRVAVVLEAYDEMGRPQAEDFQVRVGGETFANRADGVKLFWVETEEDGYFNVATAVAVEGGMSYPRFDPGSDKPSDLVWVVTGEDGQEWVTHCTAVGEDGTTEVVALGEWEALRVEAEETVEYANNSEAFEAMMTHTLFENEDVEIMTTDAWRDFGFSEEMVIQGEPDLREGLTRLIGDSGSIVAVDPETGELGVYDYDFTVDRKLKVVVHMTEESNPGRIIRLPNGIELPTIFYIGSSGFDTPSGEITIGRRYGVYWDAEEGKPIFVATISKDEFKYYSDPDIWRGKGGGFCEEGNEWRYNSGAYFSWLVLDAVAQGGVTLEQAKGLMGTDRLAVSVVGYKNEVLEEVKSGLVGDGFPGLWIPVN